MNREGAAVAAATLATLGAVVAARQWLKTTPKEDENEDGLQKSKGFDIKCSISRSQGGNTPLWSTPTGAFLASAITELDIGGCGLSELPSSVGSMVSLRKLNAAKNLLDTLPVEVSNLKSLRVAFFLGCQFKVLPEVLGTLPNLFMLSFKANKLCDVPSASLSPSIVWLILSDNCLSALPDTIGDLAGLRKLMLAGNRLESLPPSLGKCSRLELVRLADNKLQAVPFELLRLPKLAWLALASNDFNRDPFHRQGHHHHQAVLGAESVVVDPSAVLGNGASGVVFRGELNLANTNNRAAAATAAAVVSDGSDNPNLGGSSGCRGVAVKIFRSGKTSDGDPADEMAASAVAGLSGCPHLMPSFGVLDPQVAKGVAADAESIAAAKAAGGGGGGGVNGGQLKNVLGIGGGVGGLALVLELLDGYDALGGPPSFSSVTRDVYAGDGAQVDPLTGECAAPSLAPPSSSSSSSSSMPQRLASLALVERVLVSVAWAATALHSKGIAHGDIYAHNILLKPPPPPGGLSASSPRDGVGGGVGGEVEKEEDGFAILSDLGAATFYKTPSSSSFSSSSDGVQTVAEQRAIECCALVERIEVLAFGHLMGELLDRCLEARSSLAASRAATLRSLAADCCGGVVANRPSFAVVLRTLREINCRQHLEVSSE